MLFTAITENKILGNKYSVVSLFVSLAVISALVNMDSNNYDIYRYVFTHVADGTSLFKPYPYEYSDVNHYGPFFGMVIAPFAILPRPAGLMLWHLFLALSYYFAVRKSTFSWSEQLLILWLCANELYTALGLSQFNIIIVDLILLTFFFVENKEEHWAALCIVIGAFVKIYGLAGLAFFFFSAHKRRFLLAVLGWSVLCFCLPMLISSPEYVVSQYVEWYHSIVAKNHENTFAFYQNISAVGMVRKISGNSGYSDLVIIIPAMLVLLGSLLRTGQFGNRLYRRNILASVLMFIVLFSSGSESCTYIIAFTGTMVWYLSYPVRRGRLDICLMVFAIVITSLSPTDIFPSAIRKNLIQPYALKSLPVLIIWAKLCWETYTTDYGAVPCASRKPVARKESASGHH